MTFCCSYFTFYLPRSTHVLLFIGPQIQLPTSGLDHSSSDSSDFSSEDDSTVVLMKTRSRSTSPRRGKRRSHPSRSHSRSSSPDQAKMKAGNDADRCTSSISAPAERESTGCPADGISSQVSAPGEKEKQEEDSRKWGTTESSCFHRSHNWQMLSFIIYIQYTVCLLQSQYTVYDTILFRYSHLVYPEDVLCLQLLYLPGHIYIFLTIHSVQYLVYYCPFSGVNSTGSEHLTLGNSQGLKAIQSMK